MLIIWDYFGVIAQDHFWYTAERLAERHGMSDGIYEAHRKVNLGLMSWEDYCREVANDIDVPLKDVLERYSHHRINQDVIRAVRHFDDHRHVVLSNAAHDYLLPIMDQLGLCTIFSDVYVSSQIGYSKPDPRAFQHVLNEAAVSPDQAVMIDDAVRNIEAAQALGLQGLVYEPGVDISEYLKHLSA